MIRGALVPTMAVSLAAIAVLLERLVERIDPEKLGARTPAPEVDDAAMLERWRLHRIAVDGVEGPHAQKCVESAARFLIDCRTTLATADAAVIAEWVQSRTCTRRRTANVMSMLRFLGDFLIIERVREDNPWRAFRMARVRRGKGYDAITEAEAEAIFNVCRRQMIGVDGRRRIHGRRRLAFYRFLWLTGLRWKEAANQRWDDIDLGRGTMRMTLDKSRRHDTIPLSREAVELLREWRTFLDGRAEGPERSSPRVFHRPVGRKLMRRDLLAAGLPRGKGLFHRWRVGFVTRLLDSGAPIADAKHLARHLTLEQTHGYDRAALDRLRSTLEMNNRRDGAAEAPDNTRLVKPAYAVHKKKRMKGMDAGGDSADSPDRHAADGSLLSIANNEKRHPDQRANRRQGVATCSGDASRGSHDGAECRSVRMDPGGFEPLGRHSTAIADLAAALRLMAGLLAERVASGEVHDSRSGPRGRQAKPDRLRADSGRGGPDRG